MDALPKKMPPAVVLEKIPAFVPRMVMTEELSIVFREVIRQWQHRERFAGLVRYGIRPLDRLLFYGPPGNGKSMACQWICKTLGVPLYRVRCEQLHGSALGQSTQATAGVMEFLGSLTTPSVCLFDEVEGLFVDRKISSGQCDRELGSALGVVFQALDRWQAPTLIVMATNLPDQLDAALLSRVELRLEFRGPTEAQALEVVDYWRELLCDFGADAWGPRLADAIRGGAVPASFRELQQAIGRLARDWVASGISP